MNYHLPPQSPYGHSPYYLDTYRKPLRRYSNIIGGGLIILQVLTLLLYLLLSGAFSFVDYAAISIETADLIRESLELVNYCLSFWLSTLFIMALVGIPSQAAFPMRRPRASIWIPAVFVALAASILGAFFSGILSFLVEYLTGMTPYMPDMPIPQGIAANVVHFFSIAVAPAVFEELLFRGVLLQSLRRFGDGFALWASAILFGLMHQNLVQAPNAVLMGLVIGYFVLRTGTVVTGILLHFVNNGLVLLLGYLEPLLTVEHADRLYVGVYVGYLALGAVALVFLAVRHGNLFRLAESDCPLSGGQKFFHFFVTAAMIFFMLGAVLMTAYFFE